MFDQILVSLDGSELAERALAPAFALGQRQQGQVFLLRVAVLVPNTYLAGFYGRLWPEQAVEPDREVAVEYLNTIRTRAPAPPRVRNQVLEYGVAEPILDVAAAEGADLIVMSSHGYSGITRWILGSVAEKVLSGAPCPVLVVRSAEPVHRVLIPLDGSELSEQALEPGLAVAAGLGCKVTLLRAVPRVTAGDQGQPDKVEPELGQGAAQCWSRSTACACSSVALGSSTESGLSLA